MHVLHPQLTFVEKAISIYQARLSLSDGLYLRTRKYHTRRIGIDKLIVVAGATVVDLYFALRVYDRSRMVALRKQGC